ncbi:protein yippee-like At3g08990 [Lathyrus oleraceus]|uniref:Protein yippee-like n=1 Tax=Pisum sativum TaxID=3888 RepID=A0A9D4XX64_PEA|nr:protein yippee-like At3g08990 [Pisum sativum]KAI5426835.1 hypothetical protein KIW84_032314 [Pisum sativum]
MGRLFLIDLEENFYSCKNCETPIALANHLLSRDYQCPYGRAYLFDKVVNVLDGEREEPIPGSNSTIIHLFCVQCQYIVGFIFVRRAVLENQRSMIILIRCLLTTSFGDTTKESLSLQG